MEVYVLPAAYRWRLIAAIMSAIMAKQGKAFFAKALRL